MNLLIDFGASRIKSVVIKNKESEFTEIYETPGSIFNDTQGQVDLKFFKKSLINHLDHFSKINITKIIGCGEMHNFALASKQNIKYKNKFFSWRYSHPMTNVSLLELKKIGLEDFTKMALRPGLPSINLNCIKSEISGTEIIDILLFPSVFQLDGEKSLVNKSIAHSSGFYNLDGNVSSYFNKLRNFNFPIVVDDNQCKSLGSFKYKGKKITIGSFIGDLQAACIGSKLGANEVLLNLGTGSQIIAIYNNKFSFGQELRPYINNQLLECITHIPSGRHFNLWEKKLISLDLIQSREEFWNYINNIKHDEIIDSQTSFKFEFNELGVKELARSYKPDVRYFILRLVSSYINQYISLLKNKINTFKIIKISGGIIHKIPGMKSKIESELKKDVIVEKESGILTLNGLREMLSLN